MSSLLVGSSLGFHQMDKCQVQVIVVIAWVDDNGQVLFNVSSSLGYH